MATDPICDECGNPDSTAGKDWADRKAVLARLDIGDVFHAHWPGSEASLICLVTAVSDTVIRCRTVTTQLNLVFSRQTGVEMSADERPARIDSVAPLPPDIYAVILGIDRKSRLALEPADFKLSDAEKRAFVYLTGHYSSKPI